MTTFFLPHPGYASSRAPKGPLGKYDGLLFHASRTDSLAGGAEQMVFVYGIYLKTPSRDHARFEFLQVFKMKFAAIAQWKDSDAVKSVISRIQRQAVEEGSSVSFGAVVEVLAGFSHEIALHKTSLFIPTVIS